MALTLPPCASGALLGHLLRGQWRRRPPGATWRELHRVTAASAPCCRPVDIPATVGAAVVMPCDELGIRVDAELGSELSHLGSQQQVFRPLSSPFPPFNFEGLPTLCA